MNGFASPRGNWLFGHSNHVLHNSGLNGTLNSRFTSWSIYEDVAKNYALLNNGKGIILKTTLPKSAIGPFNTYKNLVMYSMECLTQKSFSFQTTLSRGCTFAT